MDQDTNGQGLPPVLQEACCRICSGMGNVFITGPSGSGKTAVLSHVASRMAKEGKKVLLCAPTAASAEALGEAGSTIFHALDIPFHLTREGKLASIPSGKLEGLHALIIDQISRCSAVLIDIIWTSYKEAREAGAPFRFIVGGDYFQVGPVMPPSVRNDVQRLPQYRSEVPFFTFQSAHWNDFNFERFLLPEPVQPADPAFAKALCRLRKGDESAFVPIQQMTAASPMYVVMFFSLLLICSFGLLGPVRMDFHVFRSKDVIHSFWEHLISLRVQKDVLSKKC